MKPSTRRGKLVVIVPACNEEETIGSVIDEVKQLGPAEIVVVENGSTDRTGDIALARGARVLHYDMPLGNDVPRAVGALHTEADIYLFTDADIVIPAAELSLFVEAVEDDIDLATNAVDWCARVPSPDPPSLCRYFLNVFLQRRDLGMENVLNIPHAFSARALQRIGKHVLANPLLATARVIEEGLLVDPAHSYNVLGRNRTRPAHETRPGEPMRHSFLRIHGDTVEALRYYLNQRGPRGGFGQGRRNRQRFKHQDDFFNPWQWGADGAPTHDVTMILSVSQDTPGLGAFLDWLQTYPIEIIAVAHGASGRVKRVLADHDLPFVDIPQYVGHEVAFAIGAQLAKTPLLFFHDAMIPLDPYEIDAFVTPLRNHQADVVVNNQSQYVRKLEGMQTVHLGAYFLNIVGQNRELAASTMLLPPYALTRDALEKLHVESLLSPGLAQMRAFDCGLRIKAASPIDYDGRLNVRLKAVLLEEDRIIGDLMEGLWYWTERFGYRGGFHDADRVRTVLADASPAYPLEPPSEKSTVDFANVVIT
ncbi:glycosyltransferase [Alicyclobacillus cycloheptanicus]|uniref:Glycosyltransferase involved in cell wall biosynthesis n=1 Tax=Alicyclobacillus cycloheptanicus TaxID=1457 RepID=A0ABT9XM61_9BACL|nr:glycosyltransferase [Alicyclobacillus cycloheptanicus]MDQ0190818.1 glycosyltransferase involved in cell wall biosynthesis [Alicyclobacillus cycloheptanicus]WDM02703.1 glycosyltransferase [Alicyclobacillus cycloheptanicus]